VARSLDEVCGIAVLEGGIPQYQLPWSPVFL
jgi:hypothetical protein